MDDKTNKIKGLYNDCADAVDELLKSYWSKHDATKIDTHVLQSSNICHRCGKTVYPVERIDVGVIIHKSCFKCKVCGRQMTINTFQLVNSGNDEPYEIFCNHHVPKFNQALIDKDSLAIKSALEIQKINATKGAHDQKCVDNWSYDPFLSPGSNFVQEINIDYGTMPRATLRSYTDFERHGIFDAQSQLERIHKDEEDKLYKQMLTQRQDYCKYLENLLHDEKEKITEYLNEVFKKQNIAIGRRNASLKKFYEVFTAHTKEQHDLLLKRLAEEETNAVSRLIEKHSKEMINLIRQKECDLSTWSNAETEVIKETLNCNSIEVFENTDACYTESPKRLPPEYGKQMMNCTPNVFIEQDKCAVEESRKDHIGFTNLVRKLSYKCESELQKVRAIFRWITAKNLAEMNFEENLKTNSVIGILRGIQQGTETYHNLFQRLCSYAGLHCEIIDGYSKGAGYRPGSPIHGELFRNQWTAVCVEGDWRFINVKWGSRHVNKARGNDTQFVYKCDEFYFLTDPENHIYQHFPDDQEWQLLDEHVSLNDFIKLPVVKSTFYNHNLSFAGHHEGILHAEDGNVNIHVFFKKLIPFSVKVRPKHHDSIIESSLESSTLITVTDNQVNIFVALKYPSKYYLDIFVAKSWKKETLEMACSFLIKCKHSSVHSNFFFPQIGTFGRSPKFHQLGFKEGPHLEPYHLYKSESILNFLVQKEMKVSHKFELWNQNDRFLSMDRYAMKLYHDKEEVSYTIRCPKKGLYVFSLILHIATDDLDNEECIYRSLINCVTSHKNVVEFPIVTRRWLNCHLLCPFDGKLSVNKNHFIQIKSSLLKDVICKFGKKTFNFIRVQNYAELWTCDISTSNMQGPLTVFGTSDSSRKKYFPLLEYTICSQTE